MRLNGRIEPSGKAAYDVTLTYIKWAAVLGFCQKMNLCLNCILAECEGFGETMCIHKLIRVFSFRNFNKTEFRLTLYRLRTGCLLDSS